MTTETNQVTPHQGSRVLLGAAAGSVALGLVLSVVGALAAGAPAAVGALLGTALVVLVLAGGAFSLNEVAGLLPAASLLVALLTYTLQVLALGLALAALSRSSLLDGTADRDWLGGAVIAGTAGWVTAQVVLATRARIPAYDLDRVVPGPAPARAGER